MEDSTAAAQSYEKAGELCGRSGPDSCLWYHGARPWLRLLGLVGGPERNETFFRDALGKITRADGIDRLLISGSADAAILAVVLRAIGDAGGTPYVTVIDRCATPLWMCRRHAEELSVEIETDAADILNYSPEIPFDVICADAFLTQFAAEQRPALIGAWARLLRPGGKVVTTARLKPDGTVKSTPEQVGRFRDNAYREAEKRRAELSIEPEEIAALAEDYARRLTLYNPASGEEIARLFEDGGFTIERLDLVDLPRSGRVDDGGAKTGRYAELVAVRA